MDRRFHALASRPERPAIHLQSSGSNERTIDLFEDDGVRLSDRWPITSQDVVMNLYLISKKMYVQPSLQCA